MPSEKPPYTNQSIDLSDTRFKIPGWATIAIIIVLGFYGTIAFVSWYKYTNFDCFVKANSFYSKGIK
jgi:hypothetical protein